jgi:hypothetical protein
VKRTGVLPGQSAPLEQRPHGRLSAGDRAYGADRIDDRATGQERLAQPLSVGPREAALLVEPPQRDRLEDRRPDVRVLRAGEGPSNTWLKNVEW